MDPREAAALEDARRKRRARLRLYESLGVALFMALLMIGLWVYVQTRLP